MIDHNFDQIRMLMADHPGNQEDRDGKQLWGGISKSAWQHRGDHHHAWLCLTMLDRVMCKPCMTLPDHAWPCLTMFDYVWPCLTLSDQSPSFTITTICKIITNSICICDHNHLHLHQLNDNLSRVTLHSSTTQARSNTSFTTTATWQRWALAFFKTRKLISTEAKRPALIFFCKTILSSFCKTRKPRGQP